MCAFPRHVIHYMEKNMKLILWILLLFLGPLQASSATQNTTDEAIKGKCLTCHKEKSPGLYRQWYGSRHAMHNVTCYDCHAARKSEPDAFLHEGAWIATLVTPKDCAGCHQVEAEEFARSSHAMGADILDSEEAWLGWMVGGEPGAVAGCVNCHGSKITIDPESPNKLSASTWPNSGIGPINPDGSRGSCNSCHSRHSFSAAQARQPEVCGKCHVGTSHPQKEIYTDSKHGAAYYTNKDKMNLDSDTWVVGQDYDAAPTCATCHLSAAGGQPRSHDPGRRLSWDLQDAVSTHTENWKSKRSAMREVCRACHGDILIDGHYQRLDGIVNLYNQKFAIPASRIMGKINANRPKGANAYTQDVDWAWWELTHNGGAHARSGAAMLSPDHTWWQGMYETAQVFYSRFIPAVRATGNAQAIALLDSVLTHDPLHAWMSGDPEKLRGKILDGSAALPYMGFDQPEAPKR